MCRPERWSTRWLGMASRRESLVKNCVKPWDKHSTQRPAPHPLSIVDRHLRSQLALLWSHRYCILQRQGAFYHGRFQVCSSLTCPKPSSTGPKNFETCYWSRRHELLPGSSDGHQQLSKGRDQSVLNSYPRIAPRPISIEVKDTPATSRHKNPSKMRNKSELALNFLPEAVSRIRRGMDASELQMKFVRSSVPIWSREGVIFAIKYNKSSVPEEESDLIRLSSSKAMKTCFFPDALRMMLSASGRLHWTAAENSWKVLPSRRFTKYLSNMSPKNNRTNYTYL